MPFERLAATQSEIAERLKNELEGGMLPQALLFSGPVYSSRLTAALELAAALLGGDEIYERLESSNLVILSSRDNLVRARALRNILEKKRTKKAMEDLVHQSRIMLSAFHESLYTASEKEAFAAAGELSDLLYDEPEEYEGKAFDDFLKKYDEKLSLLLSKQKKSTAFTIDQLRAIQSFLQQNAGQNKVVILENVENVTVGAMNSILKLLEEPPEGATLILISTNRKRIIQTILSRVRVYDFPNIRDERQKAFLFEHFGSNESTIEEFYLSSSGLDLARLDSFAEDFIYSLVVRKTGFNATALNELASFLDGLNTYSLFFGRLVKILEDGLVREKVDRNRLDRLVGFVNNTVRDSEIYSQSRRLTLDLLQRGILTIE